MDVLKGRKTNYLGYLKDINSQITVALSLEEVKSLLLRERLTDSKHLDEDCYTAWLVLNSWCALFADITNSLSYVLAARILRDGISRVIEEASRTKTQLCQGVIVTDNFWSKYAGALDREDLILLTFPKRMRLAGKDNSWMFVDYTKANRFCRRHQIIEPSNLTKDEELDYCWSNYFILDSVRATIVNILSDWKQDKSLFALPPGSTFEGHKTYLEKFKQVLTEGQWLRERGVNIPFYPVKQRKPSDCNRYSIVPKDFTKGRGIAPEPVSRQVLGYTIDSGIRTCLLKYGVDLTDQERNRGECMLSFAKHLATVDMKSASDSISTFLVRYLLQDLPELLTLLEDCRTNYINVNGQIIENGRFCTMGNAITFSLESCIFLAMAIVATRWALNEEVSDLTDAELAKLFISVYGDDVILPDIAYENYKLIATNLGFSVNEEKSYTGDQPYRESCGVEAILVERTEDGAVITNISESPKWPRGTSNHPLQELIGLQHKAANHYFLLDSFLTSIIMIMEPKMTQSEIGSNYSDIWVDQPNVTVKGHSPYAQIVTEKSITINHMSYDHDWYGNVNILLNPVEINWINGNINMSHANSWIVKPERVTNRSFMNLECPHEDNLEIHYTLTSKPTKVVLTKEDSELVELLAYYMTLGGGIEHVNAGKFTKPENTIMCRQDLVRSRTEIAKFQKYVI